MSPDFPCGLSLVTVSTVEQNCHEGSVSLFQGSLEDRRAQWWLKSMGYEKDVFVRFLLYPLISYVILGNLVYPLSLSFLTCK